MVDAAPTAAAAGNGDAVKERILALVVEKTGYPADMLDLDLDLEADLGVDTVKQAEIFAAIREIYNIPRDENRKLRDFPTLAHVIRFVLREAAGSRWRRSATLAADVNVLSQPRSCSSRNYSNGCAGSHRTAGQTNPVRPTTR